MILADGESREIVVLGYEHPREKPLVEFLDPILVVGGIDQVGGGAWIVFEIVEFFDDTMAEEVNAGLNGGVGFSGGLHRFKGIAFVVVFVAEFAIGEGVENVAKIFVLNRAHRFGRSADGVVDLREDEFTALLFFAF